MIREQRYVVVKIKDVKAALNTTEENELTHLLWKVANVRSLAGKQPLVCVIAEKGQPEYEIVWNLIERRVDNK